MCDFLNGYRFADVHIDRWCIADTLSYKFDDRHKLGLGLGLSYELNEADIRKNTAQPENPIKPGFPFASSQQIWKTHYGYDFNGKVRRHALSGELKYDFTPSETQNTAFPSRIWNASATTPNASTRLLPSCKTV